MKQRQRIAEQWESFERAVLDPKRATTVEREEARRVFYAGVEAMMRICVDTAVMPDDVAERVLQAVDDEMRAFVEELKRERQKGGPI